jgi:hypothetical protein
LDYFYKNVSLIKFSGEKSKAISLMLPLISCAPDNFLSPKLASAKIIIQATISSVRVSPCPWRNFLYGYSLNPIPYSDRVDTAIKKILASRSWTQPQRKWLERIGKQLKVE